MELDGLAANFDNQYIFHSSNPCDPDQSLHVAHGLVSGRNRPVVAGPSVDVRRNFRDGGGAGLVDVADEVPADEVIRSSDEPVVRRRDHQAISETFVWQVRVPCVIPRHATVVSSEHEAMFRPRRIPQTVPVVRLQMG